MENKKIDLEKLSIEKIRELIHISSGEHLKELAELLGLDKRKGVRLLSRTILRRLEIENNQIIRQELLLREETKLWARGYKCLGGVDEVGRGPLAGPVIAACVVFDQGTYIDGVDDSKKLSAKRRYQLFDIILKEAKIVKIGRVSHEEIDRINILRATRLAMEQAVEQCTPIIDFLLADAMEGAFPVPYVSLIKGDARSHSIAAASIVAKVVRDREMEKWHERYPQYGFYNNKGYGTKDHIEALRLYGPCPIHRRTFIGKILHGI